MSSFFKQRKSEYLAIILLVVLPTVSWCQTDPVSFFHPATSINGTVAFDSNMGGVNGVYILNKDGSYLRISPLGVSSSHPAWSLDGRFLSYESNRQDNYDIYAYDFELKKELQLTSSDSVDAVSKWGLNHTFLFESNRSGKFKMYRKKVGDLQTELITEKFEVVNYPVWSPDGSMVLFSTLFEGDMELCISDSEFTNVIRLTRSEGHDAFGSWASDGKRVAFTSRRTGSNEIYMINIDGTGLKQITSGTENSAMPSFLPGDAEIVFMSRQEGKPSQIYRINLSNKRQDILTKRVR